MKKTFGYTRELKLTLDDGRTVTFPDVEIVFETKEERKEKMHTDFFERLEDLGHAYDKAHPDSRRFYEILLSLAELHDRKQADYGRDADPFANVRAAAQWGMNPSLGVMLRMGDKFGRLQSFAQKGSLQNESVEDSLRDIAVYAVIGLVLMELGE